MNKKVENSGDKKFVRGMGHVEADSVSKGGKKSNRHRKKNVLLRDFEH